jgi:hypothetical protein
MIKILDKILPSCFMHLVDIKCCFLESGLVTVIFPLLEASVKAAVLNLASVVGHFTLNIMMLYIKYLPIDY